MNAFRRECLVHEGFGRLDDAQLARLDVPLRFSPALCLLGTATATLTGSAGLFAILATLAATAAVTRRHPFDFVWDWLVRPAVHGPRLPKAPCPRRFAFIMATPVLGGAALAFAVGAPAIGFGLAVLQMSGCAAYVLTGWCGASVVHERLFRRQRTLQGSPA